MGIPFNCTYNVELPRVQEIETVIQDSRKQDDILKKRGSSEFCSDSSTPYENSNALQKPLTSSSSNKTGFINWLQNGRINKFALLLLSFCFPIDSASYSCSGSCQPFMVCVPSNPTVEKPKEPEKKQRLKPVGLVTRNKNADFIGGRFVGGCTCGSKNGLTGNCPRISCQDNPGCLMNPPQCWPQFKEPEPPPPPLPDQKIICVPIQLVYYDPSENNSKQ